MELQGVAAWLLIGAAVYMTVVRLRPTHDELSVWLVICIATWIIMWPILAIFLYFILKDKM